MTELQLLALLDTLYEGILAPGGWSSMLAGLARATGSDAASLVMWNRQTDLAMVGDQVGLPDTLVQDYAAHFHRLDPARGLIDGIATGQWYCDERDFGRAAMRGSSFYQEFLRPHALDSTMASPFLRTPQGLEGFLSLSAAAGRRDLPRVAAALQRAMPHIQRAAALRVRLQELAQVGEMQARVLDQFNFPLLVVRADRKIVLANRLGGAWLSQPGNPLGSGSLQQRPMAALLKAACGPGPRRAAGLRLNRRDGGHTMLTAVPLPLEGAAHWDQTAPLALVLVTEPGESRPHGRQLLTQMFGLTPAEVRLLGPLLAGNTLREACDGLGISMPTGRTQLSAVFDKLGVRRQADLIRLLGRLDVLDHG